MSPVLSNLYNPSIAFVLQGTQAQCTFQSHPIARLRGISGPGPQSRAITSVASPLAFLLLRLGHGNGWRMGCLRLSKDVLKMEHTLDAFPVTRRISCAAAACE